MERAPIDAVPAASTSDVAIVGMACIFPGAATLREYWENIVAKVDATSDPPEEWEAELFYDPSSHENDRIYCKRGGYLGDLATFDPVKYGVMPSSIDGGEPDQFLALRVAHEALADAGYLDRPVNRERVGVIIGRGTYINRGFTTVLQHGLVVDRVLEILRQLHPEHSEGELSRIKRELKDSLPPFNAEMAPALVPNMMSGRIANRLDLMGPNYTVDAACASSLVAVDLAIQDLRSGRADLVLAGGVHASTPAPILQIFCQLGALSRRGQLRPFDADADGTLLGEGLGFLVLKRLGTAEADGDRIHAVLKGVGISSDGRALGLLAPRREGEELALRRAYADAGVDPASVGLVEAHGTGIPLGDEAEVQALTSVFGTERWGEGQWCALGSVKSMISHLIPAAGIAGMIKVALALYHKVLPATLHAENPNPALELHKTPFYLNTETRPWVHGHQTPRRAGVNAFGFGGINGHAILEEHRGVDDPAASSYQQRWDTEVCIVEAADRDDLVADCRRLHGSLSESTAELKDVAATLNLRSPGPCRLGLVASSVSDLVEKLGRAAERLSDPRTDRLRDAGGTYFFSRPLGAGGKLAFLFPGEGSQYVNMLADVCIAFPEARAWFDLVDRAFVAHDRHYLPSSAVFPLPGTGTAGEEAERLWQMDCGPETLFAASQAMLTILTRLGIHPDAVVGHSTGEYSALIASGAGQSGDQAALLRDMSRLNKLYEGLLREDRLVRGVLVAVGAVDRVRLDSMLTRSSADVHIAMDNCPHQVVLWGTEPAISEATTELERAGAVCQRLPFGRAYHTPLFQPFSDQLEHFMQTLSLNPPQVDLYSCMTADRYPKDVAQIRTTMAQQWARPVRFAPTINRMYEDGVRMFVEVGPRNNLTAFVDDILRGRPYLAVASNVEQRSGLTQLNHLVAVLAASGVTMDRGFLSVRRAPARVALDSRTSAAARPSPSRGLRLATGLQPLRLAHPDALRSAKPAEAAVAPAAQAREVTFSPSQDSSRGRAMVMDAYLATMERFLATQQEVTCSFAGAPASGDPAPDRFPFLRGIISHDAGRDLVARCDLDLKEDIFLLDHTLETGLISTTESELVGLPVMPLTMSMETLAEAASVLVPGKLVVGMTNVRAHRWIVCETESVPLRVAAHRMEDDAVEARIESVGDSGAGDGPTVLVEATVTLAGSYPPAPPAGKFAVTDERPGPWAAGRMYEGTGMFHGPTFQVVQHLGRSGRDGAEASLAVPTGVPVFRSHTASLHIDPVVLDALGQVAAFWVTDRFPRGRNIFPFALKRLDLYREAMAPAERATCRVMVTSLNDEWMRSDIELVGTDGHLRARMTDWQDRRIDLPGPLSDFLACPEAAFLSEPWGAPAEPLPARNPLRARRVTGDLMPMLERHGGIWLKVLAYAVLSRAERGEWLGLQDASARRRHQWLMGRIAAKDAVRVLLREIEGRVLCPADVELAPDPLGRPKVRLPRRSGTLDETFVSIAHCADVAVAVAGFGSGEIGVDIELVGSVTAEVEETAFSEAELALLKNAAAGGLSPSERSEWLTRLWCAKEAVAKALGTGLAGDPRSVKVSSMDTATGLVWVEMPGAAPGTLPAYTARDGGFAVATSLATYPI